ncbi:MAG: hypothetical protein V9E93_15285 [Steroidobacteraceae bacterium]
MPPSLGCENLRFAATLNLGGAAPVAALQDGRHGGRERLCHTMSWCPRAGTGISGVAYARDFRHRHRRDPRAPRWRATTTCRYGLSAPPHWYALMAQRHMHEYGTRAEQLGAVASRHAQARPAQSRGALMCGKPMTMTDYLASPMICAPYRLLDCCLETDGAAAYIVTSTRAGARPAGSSP